MEDALEDALLGRLVSTLVADLEVYRDLLDLARKKQNLVVKGDLVALEGLVEVEEALVQRAGRLEGERQEITLGLARAWGLPADALTLSDIEKRCRGDSDPATQEAGTRLGEIHAELKGLLEELHERNQENMQLLKRAMSVVRFSLQHLLPDGAVYAPGGDRRYTSEVPRTVDHHA